MKNSRYEVYTSNRPARIALILDPQDNTTQVFNQSLRFLMDKWGGRYNPIIIPDDGVISKGALVFLERFSSGGSRNFVRQHGLRAVVEAAEITPLMAERPRG